MQPTHNPCPRGWPERCGTRRQSSRESVAYRGAQVVESPAVVSSDTVYENGEVTVFSQGGCGVATVGASGG